MPTSFINPMKVPADRTADFLKLWDEGAAYVATQPGFISTSLHRALSADAGHQYFTVAVWATPEHFAAATSTAGGARTAPASAR
jgi:heme oxygenase (mycobilin-producing)